MKRNSSFQLPQINPRKNIENLKVKKKNNKSLDFEMLRPVQIRIRKQPLNILPKILTISQKFIQKPSQSKLITLKELKALNNHQSSSSSDEFSDNISFNCEIFQSILEDFLIFLVKQVIFESFSEITNAALTLHASSLMDRLLKEQINILVVETVLFSIDELKNYELFDMSEKLLDLASSEFIKKICFDCSFDMISKILSENILNTLDFLSIVLESLSEEMIFYEDLVQTTADLVFEAILEEDWLEILVEDEVSHAKIVENFKILPVKVQEELFADYFSVRLEELLESLYFDLVDHYVAEIWLKNLVEAVVAGLGEIDELILMPCHVFSRRKKDSTIFYSYYYNIHALR
jgi:hypothetical protein